MSDEAVRKELRKPESARKMAREIALSLAGMSAPYWLEKELLEWEKAIRADVVKALKER